MTLKKELSELKKLFGTDTPEFEEQIQKIAATYTTEEDKKEIALFFDECIGEVDKGLTELEENCIKFQLKEVSEIISLSWLAKKYFGKTKAWLYQRINNNIVNGKPAKFTPEEIEKLNQALQDISHKIGSLRISY